MKKNKQTKEDQGNKQVDAFKPLELFQKQLPSIKYFIPKEGLNPEIINELERTEKEERKLIEIKWFTKDIIERMSLENLKRYVLSAVILEVIL